MHVHVPEVASQINLSPSTNNIAPSSANSQSPTSGFRKANRKIPLNLNPIVGHNATVNPIGSKLLIQTIPINNKHHPVQPASHAAVKHIHAPEEGVLPQRITLTLVGEDKLLVVAELVGEPVLVLGLGGVINTLLDGLLSLGVHLSRH